MLAFVVLFKYPCYYLSKRERVLLSLIAFRELCVLRLKNYFERLNHNANTRSNGKTLKLPKVTCKVKLDLRVVVFIF